MKAEPHETVMTVIIIRKKLIQKTVKNCIIEMEG